MNPAYLLSIYLLLPTVGAIAGAGEQSASVSADEQSQLAIAAQARRFSAAYVAGDLDTLMGIYAEDGVAGPGGRDFIRGRAALRELWTLPEGHKVSRHRTRAMEVVVDGRHAYDWGYYEGAAGPADQPREFRGKYLIVWQLDDDGQWRMAQDLWNRLPDPD